MYYSASVLRSVELWLVYKSTRALFSICIQSYIVAFIYYTSEHIYVITAAKQKLLACSLTSLSVTRSGLVPVFLM